MASTIDGGSDRTNRAEDTKDAKDTKGAKGAKGADGIERTCRLAESRFGKVTMTELVRGFYTADARYITPDQQVLQGRAQIAAYLQTAFDSLQATGMRLETLASRACGPGCVYVIGNGTLVLASGDELPSNYLCIFREEGGEWLCETEMAGMNHLDLTAAQ
jgi:ketosteroid isomerase-like protein